VIGNPLVALVELRRAGICPGSTIDVPPFAAPAPAAPVVVQPAAPVCTITVPNPLPEGCNRTPFGVGCTPEAALKMQAEQCNPALVHFPASQVQTDAAAVVTPKKVKKPKLPKSPPVTVQPVTPAETPVVVTPAPRTPAIPSPVLTPPVNTPKRASGAWRAATGYTKQPDQHAA
jgi:hypothetical protein